MGRSHQRALVPHAVSNVGRSGKDAGSCQCRAPLGRARLRLPGSVFAATFCRSVKVLWARGKVPRTPRSLVAPRWRAMTSHHLAARPATSPGGCAAPSVRSRWSAHGCTPGKAVRTTCSSCTSAGIANVRALSSSSCGFSGLWTTWMVRAHHYRSAGVYRRASAPQPECDSISPRLSARCAACATC